MILYLEDSRDKITEMRFCLRPLGYTLQTVPTVAAAISALEHTSGFTLVMSGVHLELENTLDLVHFVRHTPELEHLPIILIDSHQTKIARTISESLEVVCQKLGVTRYLSMAEFDPKQVCALITDTIDAFESRLPAPPPAVSSGDNLSQPTSALEER